MQNELYVMRYDQVAKMDARTVARHSLLSAAGAIQAVTGRTSSLLDKPRVQFLFLHHVFSDEESNFRRLLRALADRHCIVSYSEAICRIREGRLDAPYVSMSFDDGLKNCLRAAAILDEFGVSGCFFVCTSMLTEQSFSARQRFCRERIDMPPVEFLSWKDLESLVKGGHEIGSHTVNHCRLSQLTPQVLEDEIFGARDALARRLIPPKHFSWPYGTFRDITPAAARLVFDAGFESCASAVRGCHLARPDKPHARFCIRRDHVIASWPAQHINFFLARNVSNHNAENDWWPQQWDI